MILRTAMLTLALAATQTQARHTFRAVQEVGESDTTGEVTIVTTSAALDAEEPANTSTTTSSSTNNSLNSRITVPDYTSDTCSGWLQNLFAADTDNSGGLSADEFHAFLTEGVSDPPYVDQYFDQHSSYVDLPWMFKVVHKSLACRCVDLNLGDGCCEGPNAEIPIVALQQEEESNGQTRQGMSAIQLQMAEEYKADMCNSVAASFEEVILEPNPTSSPVTGSPVTGSPTVSPVTASPVGAGVIATTTEATTVAATTAATTVTVAPVVTEPPVEPEPTVEVKGIELDIVGSVIDYRFDFAGIFVGSNENVPDFYNANDIMGNEDTNGVLGHVIKAWEQLANELLPGFAELGEGVTEDGKRKRKNRGLRGLEENVQFGKLSPVMVQDIKCPSGLPYAPMGAYCLNFKFSVAATDTDMTPFAEMLKEAIDIDGRLYDIVKTNYPDSALTGLGSPGKGINYYEEKEEGPNISEANTQDTGDEESTGLSAAATVFIIIAIIVVPMAIVAMFARYRKVQEEERQERLATYNAQTKAHERDLEAGGGDGGVAAGRMAMSPEDNDSIISDEEMMMDTGRNVKVSAGSSLAAMGAAGAAATMIKKTDSDDSQDSKIEIRKEVRFLVGETNAPKTADELMSAYEGREEELLSHLRKMHAKQTEADNDELKTEIRQLVVDTNAPKTADELLTAYAGREEELAKNLRKMKGKKYKSEIESLVEATSPGKTAEELMDAYVGREEDLIKNLQKMKTKQAKGEVASLVELTQPGKSTNELMAAYEGREDELIKNLKKMKSKKDVAEVKSLIESTNVDKSAKEMLEAYEGREDELVKNLKKMKSKQDIEQVKSLVASINSEKSAEEMLEAYEGREDELIKNLTKMKSKQDIAEVKTLVASTNPGKSAEEMLEAFEGREDELIKNLRKMKTKQDKSEIKSLVEVTNPGKSAKELMTAYEGREDELILNLTKMKEKQEKKAAKSAAAAATPADTEPAEPAAPQAAEPAAPAPSATEDNTALKAEVAQLVSTTNPGKSAEELLAAYEGREQELVTHLKKLQKSKSKRVV